MTRNKIEVASTWGTSLKIVRAEWLLACIREWRYVDEKDYSWKPFISELIDDEDNISTDDDVEEENSQSNNQHITNEHLADEKSSTTNTNENKENNVIDEDEISTEDEEEDDNTSSNQGIANENGEETELRNHEDIPSPPSSPSVNQSDKHPVQPSSKSPLHLLPNSIHTESDIIEPMASSSSLSVSQKRVSSSDLSSTEPATKRTHPTPKEK